MQRAVWQGAISFGLIHVPVEMFTASRDSSLGLHLLDSRDFAPVGYQRINKNTGKEVAWERIVKGYEYEKGRYVALSDADFRHANVKATQTIDIATFTCAGDIDPVYFETPYYLAPGKGGDKVYVLLRDALEETEKVAVATLVMRGRQHLCVVAPRERAMMLLTLRFEDEVLPPEVVKSRLPAGKGSRVHAAELTMARRLVNEMTGEFRPSEFHDTYREDLMRRIREKVRKGQTHDLAGEPEGVQQPPKAQVIDLMQALRDSLKGNGRRARKRA